MAFIYRYELEDRKLKKSLDLTRYRQDIESIIGDFFSIKYREILKSIEVFEDYFEYRLHLAVDINLLLDINLRIAFLLKKEEGDQDFSFRRMPNRYIAFIREEYLELGYEGVTSLELMDYEAYRKLESIDDIADLDLFTLRFKDRTLDYYLEDIEEDSKIGERYLLVEGNYGSNYNYPKLTGFVDADFLENYREIDKEIFGLDNYLVRNFIVGDIRFLDDGEREGLEEVKKLFKAFDDSIEDLDRDYLKRYDDFKPGEFRVYDVGQALRQSLSSYDGEDYIYFDMGIDKSSDILNYRRSPKLVRDGLVIVSHLHLDHWHMLNVDIDAYYQDYIIPRQEKGLIFTKRLAEIRARSRKVYYLDRSRSFSLVSLYLGRSSRRDESPAESKHETGIYSLIDFKNKKILLAGDQEYEYMDRLGPVDILVASHHGGDYSKYEEGSRDYIVRPRDQASTIIYSYRENNPYGHPNKLEDYRSLGWEKEHHTAKDGDYIL